MLNKCTSVIFIIAMTIPVSASLQTESSADIIVTSRYSRSFFTILAGVGSRLDRRREEPAPFESVQGFYGDAFTGGVAETLNNAQFMGTAAAEASFLNESNLSWNSSGLNATYFDSLSGSATRTGDGLAAADLNSEFEFEFTLNSEMAFAFSGEIGPSVGDTNRQFLFQKSNVNLFNFTDAGQRTESGVLDAGDYRLRIISSGDDFNDEVPFETSTNWSFQLTSVPEPGNGIFLSVLGVSAFFRRRKP